jgi:hypothetical protein
MLVGDPRRNPHTYLLEYVQSLSELEEESGLPEAAEEIIGLHWFNLSSEDRMRKMPKLNAMRALLLKWFKEKRGTQIGSRRTFPDAALVDAALKLLPSSDAPSHASTEDDQGGPGLGVGRKEGEARGVEDSYIGRHFTPALYGEVKATIREYLGNPDFRLPRLLEALTKSFGSRTDVAKAIADAVGHDEGSTLTDEEIDQLVAQAFADKLCQPDQGDVGMTGGAIGANAESTGCETIEQDDGSMESGGVDVSRPGAVLPGGEVGLS